MPRELEAKVRVESHVPVRTALRRAGAKAHGITREINIFFDTPKHTLRKSGQALRLRHNRRATGSDLVITLKGPRQPGRYKSREETELAVTDARGTRQLFAALGYEPTLTFHKKRESHTLRGCKVELDTLAGVGVFVEVEGPNEAAVTQVLKLLGLTELPQIHTSYASMAARRKGAH